MKKIICFILTLTFILSAIPIYALATDSDEETSASQYANPDRTLVLESVVNENSTNEERIIIEIEKENHLIYNSYRAYIRLITPNNEMAYCSEWKNTISNNIQLKHIAEEDDKFAQIFPCIEALSNDLYLLAVLNNAISDANHSEEHFKSLLYDWSSEVIKDASYTLAFNLVGTTLSQTDFLKYLTKSDFDFESLSHSYDNFTDLYYSLLSAKESNIHEKARNLLSSLTGEETFRERLDIIHQLFDIGVPSTDMAGYVLLILMGFDFKLMEALKTITDVPDAYDLLLDEHRDTMHTTIRSFLEGNQNQ